VTFWLLAGSVWSRPVATEQTLVVYVDAPDFAWGGSALEAKLVRHLSRSANVRVITPSSLAPDWPEFPRERYNIDSLVDWGLATGGRYLLLVEVLSQHLEKGKSFHLPLVFHRYDVTGVIQGELRLVDLRREKLVGAEPFTVRRKGPRVFQATMDDDPNDPDLHLTAFDKVRFFDRLEEEAAKHVVNWVKKLIRLR
jgi:hypothetical protein